MNVFGISCAFYNFQGCSLAISLAIGGEPTPAGLVIPEGSFWSQINQIGVVGFTLMIPILAGFIAYAYLEANAKKK